MQTTGRTSIKSIAERVSLFRVTAADSSGSIPRRPQVSGVPAREFVSRRVASSSVASSCVEEKCVELPSVPGSAFSAASPNRPSYRLDRAHVFACLKAAAAKSKVSRLLGRTTQRSSVSGQRPGFASVPASLTVASPRRVVSRSRLH